MKMSGSIRQTEGKPCRFVARWQSPLLFALPDGTARQGPDAHHSGPGSFSSVDRPKVFGVPKSVPSQPTSALFFIPQERTSRTSGLGATRSNFHE